jgi:flagellar protein FlbB
MWNKKSGKSNIFLVIFLFFILIGVVTGIIYIADYAGIIDAKEMFMPYLAKTGIFKEKQVVTGNLIEKEILDNREKYIETREKELNEMMTKLTLVQKEKEILEREKNFDLKIKESETVQDKIKRQAFYFSNMKPDESAKKLVNMPDELVVDILKNIEDQKTVAVILMKMEDEKAASILRKMAR